MLESNNWPGWLRLIWPNWLENTGYPVAGVGDLSDLKLSLGVGQDGRWIGFVNPGWFYSVNSEQYNYVSVGIVTASGVSTSGTITTSPSFRPAWGPVLVHGTTESASQTYDGPYREHHNSFHPALTLSWAAVSPAASTILKATLPASSLLIGLRDYTNLALGSVAGTGLLVNDRLYYYNLNTREVFFKPKDPTDTTPDVWADVVYTYPKLRFREIVVCEKDVSGNLYVRPSYGQIEDVKLYRGTHTFSTTGFIASGTITHTLSGTLKGDWVVLDYWISKSYVLENHRTLKYWCGGSAGSAAVDTFKVYYETSVPDTLPNITVTTPTTGIYNVFNINPMFEYGYRSGYLFHADPASAINTYWEPFKLSIRTSKSSICNSFNELLLVKLEVLADNGLPLPYYPTTVNVVGGSAILTFPNERTDGKGEMHYVIRPHASGITSITIAASCGTLTASAAVTVVGSSTLITQGKWNDGFVHVVVTNDRDGAGGFRSFACATTADGLPRHSNITITTELASEFSQQGVRSSKQLNLSQNITVSNLSGLGEFGYYPQPNDKLFCSSNTAHSKLITGED